MFNTVQEAFNHYRNSSLEEIETRAGEIKGTIENDPDADIIKLNVEIEGLNQAKENIKDKENNERNSDINSVYFTLVHSCLFSFDLSGFA